ncbi:hypothetical protein, conserved [Angomonas deanei]|uniref:Flagellar attachment zone protein 1 conserved domain-containing protein n=1 Tax=Angomonas deanei TaxID=59799 RepID=A0A7G2C7D7_9TRYP|nr:hypothetical protein, conserved [Angomonas deanei]
MLDSVVLYEKIDTKQKWTWNVGCVVKVGAHTCTIEEYNLEPIDGDYDTVLSEQITATKKVLKDFQSRFINLRTCDVDNSQTKRAAEYMLKIRTTQRRLRFLESESKSATRDGLKYYTPGGSQILLCDSSVFRVMDKMTGPVLLTSAEVAEVDSSGGVRRYKLDEDVNRLQMSNLDLTLELQSLQCYTNELEERVKEEFNFLSDHLRDRSNFKDTKSDPPSGELELAKKRVKELETFDSRWNWDVDAALVTTPHSITFQWPGGAGVVHHHPEEAIQVMTSEVAYCCHVPIQCVSEVTISCEGDHLHSAFKVTHPTTSTSTEIGRRVRQHPFHSLYLLHKEDDATKRGLDRAVAEVTRALGIPQGKYDGVRFDDFVGQIPALSSTSDRDSYESEIGDLLMILDRLHNENRSLQYALDKSGAELKKQLATALKEKEALENDAARLQGIVAKLKDLADKQEQELEYHRLQREKANEARVDRNLSNFHNPDELVDAPIYSVTMDEYNECKARAEQAETQLQSLNAENQELRDQLCNVHLLQHQVEGLQKNLEEQQAENEELQKNLDEREKEVDLLKEQAANPGYNSDKSKPQATTSHVRVFDGDEWDVVVDRHPEQLKEAFVTDACSACGVTRDDLANVAFTVGSLHAAVDVTHNSDISSDAVDEMLGAYSFPNVMDVYARRHGPKRGLDALYEQMSELQGENDELQRENEQLADEICAFRAKRNEALDAREKDGDLPVDTRAVPADEAVSTAVTPEQIAADPLYCATLDELNAARAANDELQKALEEQQAQLEEQQAQIDELVKDAEAKDEESGALARDLDLQRDELQKNLEEQLAENEEVRKENDDLQKIIEELRNALAAAEAEREALQQSVEEKEKQNDVLLRDIDEQNEVHQRELDERQAEKEELQKSLEEQQAENEEVRKENDDLQKIIEELRNALAAAEAECEALQQSVEEKEKQNDVLLRDIDEQNEVHQRELDERQAEKEELQKSLEEQQAENEEVRKENDDLQKIIEELRNALAAAEAEREALQQSVEEKEKQNDVLLRDIDEQNEVHQRELDERQAEKEELQKSLEEQQAENEEVRKENDDLQKIIEELRNALAAAEAEREALQQSVEEKEKQNDVLLRDIDEQNEVHQRELDERQAEKEELQKSLEEQQAENEEVRKENDDLQKIIEELRNALAAAEAEREALQQSVEEKEKQNDVLLRDIDEQNEVHQRELEERQAEKEELQKSLEEQQAENEEVRKENDDLQKIIEELRNALTAAEAEREALQQSVEEKEKQNDVLLRDIDEQNEVHQRELDERQAEKEELQKSLEEQQAENEEVRKENDDLQKIIEELRNALAAAEAEAGSPASVEEKEKQNDVLLRDIDEQTSPPARAR